MIYSGIRIEERLHFAFQNGNLMYMRAFAEAWPDAAIVQQAVGQLPWGHNLVLLTKLKDIRQRLAYARRAIQHGWSRNCIEGVSVEPSRVCDVFVSQRPLFCSLRVIDMCEVMA